MSPDRHLERLTEPSALVEGDERFAEGGEGVVAALVSDAQSPEVVEPGVRALDDPSVASELLSALDSTAGDARNDSASMALLAAVAGVVGLVGMQLFGTPSWSSALSPDGRDCIEGGSHPRAVVAVGSAQPVPERRAARVGDEVTLGAGLAPVGRVRPRASPPFLAGTLALSSAARDQSI